MRKYVPYALAAVMAIVAVSPMRAADHPQKPGKWQIKMEMEMPGMPFKMPPITHTMCLTAEDLADPEKSVPKSDPKQKCTISDYKVDGNTVTWSMDCPKDKMTGTGTFTYSGDTYTGTMDMKKDEQEMHMKYSGKWMGECTK